jgi:hypothetical protein
MKYIFKIFFFSTILFGNTVQYNGFGNSFEEAKKSALKEFSQFLLVEVEELFPYKKHGDISKNFYLKFHDFSHSIFDYIKFKNEVEFDGEFAISLELTENAFRDYIYNSQVEFEKSPKNREGAIEQLKKLHLLLPIIYLIPNNSSIEDFLIRKEADLLFQLNSGGLIFNSNVEAEITILEKRYTTSQNIYLSKGRYKYTLFRDGYREKSGFVTINRGEKRVKSISLISSIGERIISVEADKQFLEIAENILKNYGILVKGNSKFLLEISTEIFKEKDIKGEKYLDFSISISLYKSGELFSVQRVTFWNKSRKYIDSNIQKAIYILVETLFDNGEIEKFFH